MNSFEKNIKNKADSFEMQPAPGSFDLIMDALQKKKKRRFIFWLWILIPGVVVGCGLLLINPFQRSTPFQYLTSGSETLTWSIKITPGNHPLLSVSMADFSTQQKQYAQVNQNQPHIHSTLPSKRVQRTQHEPNNFTLHTQTKTKLEGGHTSNNTQVDKTMGNNQSEELTERVLPARIQESPLNINAAHTSFIPFTHQPRMFTLQPLMLPQHHPYLVRSNHSRWSIGAYAEAGVSKNIFANNADSAGVYYTTVRTNTDKFLFSYSAGLQVRYAPVKFLAIETGIGFTHYTANQIISDAGFNAGSATIEDSFLPDTVATIFTASAVSKEYHNVYDYISIPLKVYYQKKWKWTGVEAGAGVIFDIPVHTSSYAADDSSGLSFLRTDVPSSRLNLFGIQASVNMHMVFHANKFSFFAGPVFKYRMNSMFDKNYIVEQRSYFIGGEFGARYNF
jgi:hypothetical protein